MLFVLWFVFLSGAFTPFFGSPGIIQAIRLKRILDSKRQQFTQAENDLLHLQAEAEQLEKNRVVQQREIRRVLGYAAPDEIIFDFASDPNAAASPTNF